MNQIPNTITCVNVLSGTLAILMASRGEAQCGGLSGFQWAYLFIGIAAVADFCDGLAARLLHAYSNMGKELDSLCDMVSFGVAPSVILYYTLQDLHPGSWLCWAAPLIAVATALRLAKFNIDTRQTTSFLGLPVPANAIFWIGYTTLMRESLPVLGEWYVGLPVILLLCFMMVSEIPLFSLKIKSLRLSVCWRQLTLVLAAVILVVALGLGGLAWLILFYVLFSLAAPAGR